MLFDQLEPYDYFKNNFDEIIPLDKEILEIKSYGPTTAISDLYLKFEVIRQTMVISDSPASFYTKEGKPATIRVYKRSDRFSHIPPEFHMRSFQRAIIREIGLGNLPKFEKLVVFLKEYGKNKIEDHGKIRFKLVAGSPGKKYNIGKSNLLVPACKHCDGLLTGYFSPNSYQSSCPYCNKEMEYYWRERKIYALPFNFSKKDWEENHTEYINGHAFPIRYKGKLCKFYIDQLHCGYFLQNYATFFPNGVIGPFIIQLSPDCWTHGAPRKFGLDPDVYRIEKIAVMDHKIPDFPSAELFPKALMYPKKAFHKEDSSMQEKVKKGKEAVAKEVEKIEEKRKKEEDIKQKLINVDDLIANNEAFDIRSRLSNLFLNVIRSERKSKRDYHSGSYSYSAQFYSNFYSTSGRIPNLKVKLKTRERSISGLRFTNESLKSFIDILQQNKGQYFSEVKFYVLESRIQRKDQDPYYYLNPILNLPNVPYRVPRTKAKVKACKACDTMLLYYTFNWAIQKNDLREKVCPYCNKDLEIIERDRRVVPVYLDFNNTNCQIKGTNNQIGVMYNGVPIPLTVKVKALEYFIQNYQNLFKNNAIGPFNIRLKYQDGIGIIDEISVHVDTEAIEWRPVVLYPEDLIAY